MVSSDEVLKYLEAMDYPATKEEIVAEAEREGAPEEVLKALRGMPPAVYENKMEVYRSAKTDIADLPPDRRAELKRDREHQRIAEHERAWPHPGEPDPHLHTER
jgi:hypothetical protein